jgi:hypothetical protein
MIITISPNPSPDREHHVSFSADTESNDESTSQAVELALKLLVAYGHSVGNVAEAAMEWAGENQEKGLNE